MFNGQSQETEIKRFGDPIWAKLAQNQRWGQYPEKEIVRFYKPIKNNYELTTKTFFNPTVLDIGCGGGANAWFLKKEGAHVILLDGQPEFFLQTRETFYKFFVDYDGVKEVLSDITEPEKSINGKVDMLFDNYSLTHNPKDKIIQAYKQYRELMIPDKTVFYTAVFGKDTELEDRGYVELFVREELNKIYKDLGFKIARTIDSNIVESDWENGKNKTIKLEKLITILMI